MVKPIDVMDMWNPFEKTFGNLSRMDTAGENITSMNNPERKREKKIKKIKEINDRINKLNGRDFQNEINTYKKEIELVEKQLKNVEEETNDDSLIGTVTTYFSNNMYNKDVLKETLKFVKKQLESVMSDRVEASRQIISLREQLMNITNEPNSEPNIPEWNKDSVYAPFISKEVLDVFTEEEQKSIKINCYEWMYAQRLRFISEYYSPKSIDSLIEKFRIRFKDWTGSSNITINI